MANEIATEDEFGPDRIPGPMSQNDLSKETIYSPFVSIFDNPRMGKLPKMVDDDWNARKQPKAMNNDDSDSIGELLAYELGEKDVLKE